MELEDHPDNYVMWGFMGQEYVSQENWAEAENAFRRAVSLIPDSMRGIYDTSSSITHLRLLEVLVIRPEIFKRPMSCWLSAAIITEKWRIVFVIPRPC